MVDIPPVASGTTSAQARFDWSIGKGSGRWNGQVVVLPSSSAPRLACVYKGRCDAPLPEKDECRFSPVDTFAEYPGSNYCWFGGPPEMKGTHVIAVRAGDDCDGAVLACKDM